MRVVRSTSKLFGPLRFFFAPLRLCVGVDRYGQFHAKALRRKVPQRQIELLLAYVLLSRRSADEFAGFDDECSEAVTVNATGVQSDGVRCAAWLSRRPVSKKDR